ncbi:alpha/beta fold hydrolase [Herbidospora mongoliensis]|uniref:alpha/beta fold hydrolase n=1 Tax=Herbidospora mongoliensis TaxID=688067 RepID=UPI00082D7212|nr:alpha/beta fold hydrolase [Herbidospora mongoliensis]
MPTTSSNGITLAYETHGDPSGPPVLLINPAASSSGMWTLHQVPALVEAGHRVITFDNRGTAPSSCPPGPYDLADFADDAAGLIRALGGGPVAVAGASLGAMVAQELALAHPSLVSGIALLGTRARADFFREKMTAASAHRVRSGEGDPVAMMIQLFSARTLADEHVAADWYDLLTAFPIRGDGPALQYEATLAGDRRKALTGITCPALVVAFAEDLLMPPFMGREAAEAIPGATYTEIPGCGHYGFLERPALVNRVLVEFFKRL